MSEILKTLLETCQHAITAVREVMALDTILTQALIFGALIGFVTYKLMQKRYRLPPGPWPLPLLGHLLWLCSKKEQFYVTLDRWAREKYGPVLSVYFGPVLCVVLNDLDSVTEALVKKGKDFNGRPSFHSWAAITDGYKGVIFVDPTPAWKLHRRVATKAVRQSMTGPLLEKAVHATVDQMTSRMAAEPGPFHPQPYIYTLIFHILDRICFGEVKPYGHPTIQRLIKLFKATFQDWGNGYYEDIFPLLRFWPTKSFRKLVSSSDGLCGYYEENIQKHRQSFSPDTVRDLTDGILLAQLETAREEGSEVRAMFSDAHVRHTLADLFLAGLDTTGITLEWALLFLAGHPQIQKRAQAEIDEATGTEMPGTGHRDKLQYTQAVLYETMRRGLVSPMSMPYKTTCDTSVGGYDVPQGTLVLANLWTVMFHPGLWDQPLQFKPERFLDDQGRLKPTPTYWLPFSVGRRMCLGESVAKPELLLLLACVLKRLTFSLPQGVTFDPSSHVTSLMYHLPKPYQVVVTPR